MVPHAQFTKSQLPQAFFAALHLFKYLARHRASVFHARRKARRRRTIPHRVACRFCQGPHFQLGQCRVGQRRQHRVLLRRALPGPVVPRVVGIHPVGDVREPQPVGQLLQNQKKLILAMEAAIGVVARVFRPVEFFGRNHFERHAQRLRKRARLLHVAPRQRRRIGQHRQHAVAQNAMHRGRQKCRVHAARVGHHHAAQFHEPRLKRAQLGRRSGLRDLSCRAHWLPCSLAHLLPGFGLAAMPPIIPSAHFLPPFLPHYGLEAPEMMCDSERNW